MTALDKICDWLKSLMSRFVLTHVSESRIVYFQGTLALDWANVIKEVRKEPREFLQQGGWRMVLGTDADNGGEGEGGAVGEGAQGCCVEAVG